MLLLFIVMTTIVVVGLIAIAAAHPHAAEIIVWNDETERQFLREREHRVGWW